MDDDLRDVRYPVTIKQNSETGDYHIYQLKIIDPVGTVTIDVPDWCLKHQRVYRINRDHTAHILLLDAHDDRVIAAEGDYIVEDTDGNLHRFSPVFLQVINQIVERMKTDAYHKCTS